ATLGDYDRGSARARRWVSIGRGRRWYSETMRALFAWLATAVVAGGGSVCTVVLEAGHGGTKLGAAGRRAGLYEKQVTLEIARRVRRRLASDRGIRVVLCRQTDVLVPMRARVRCANE